MGVKEDEARGCEVGLFDVLGRHLPHLQSTLIDDPRTRAGSKEWIRLLQGLDFPRLHAALLWMAYLCLLCHSRELQHE